MDTELDNSFYIEAAVAAVDEHMSLNLEHKIPTSQLIDVCCKQRPANLVQCSSCTMAFAKCNLFGNYEQVHAGNCSLNEESIL